MCINPKRAVKNMALKSMGSHRMSQENEMVKKVLMPKTPLNVGENLALIKMLCMHLKIMWLDSAECSIL